MRIVFACLIVAQILVDIGLSDDKPSPSRTYSNVLKLMKNPPPLLNDHPEFVESVRELRRFEAPALVVDEGADLSVRSWRFSYNVRGIVEMPNRLKASATAVIMVHPWGIDDGQGWNTPEPNGAADFCTVEKNKLAGRHTKEVINPLMNRLRPHTAATMYSLRGGSDPIRMKLYRSLKANPSKAERAVGRKELKQALTSFNYRARPLPGEFTVSKNRPLRDYFRNFPGLDAGPHYNGAGYWDLPIPVSSDVTMEDDDVVIYDQDGYPALRDWLNQRGVRHVILTGYATDMCFCKTTAGYENLDDDFNVFLVGDATLATFPANSSPRYATNAHISFASLTQMITQTSWIRHDSEKPSSD